MKSQGKKTSHFLIFFFVATDHKDFYTDTELILFPALPPIFAISIEFALLYYLGQTFPSNTQ